MSKLIISASLYLSVAAELTSQIAIDICDLLAQFFIQCLHLQY